MQRSAVMTARGALLFLGFAACAASPDASRGAQTTTTSASFAFGGASDRSTNEPFVPSSAELADPAHPANRLGTAACERKRECDEIGDGKPNPTEQACLASTRRHAHESFERLSCDNGLDEKVLAECIHDVRIAECERVDRLDTFPACTRARLCAR